MKTVREVKEWILKNNNKIGFNEFMVYFLTGNINEIDPEIISVVQNSVLSDKDDMITFLSGEHISINKVKDLLKGRKLYGKYRRDISTNDKGFRTYVKSRYEGHISDSYKDLFRLSGVDNSGMDITWMYMYDEACSPYVLESIIFEDEDEYEYIVFDADKVDVLLTFILSIWEEYINNKVDSETKDDTMAAEAYMLMSINNITDIQVAMGSGFILSEIPQILARVPNEAIIGRYDTYKEMMDNLRK